MEEMGSTRLLPTKLNRHITSSAYKRPMTTVADVAQKRWLSVRRPTDLQDVKLNKCGCRREI